jgi:hypothetical protein
MVRAFRRLAFNALCGWFLFSNLGLEYVMRFERSGYYNTWFVTRVPGSQRRIGTVRKIFWSREVLEMGEVL